VLRGVPVAIACNPSPIPVLPSLKPSISISPQPSLVATSRHTHSNTTTQHSLHALPSRTIRPLEGHWPTCSHKPVKRACIMLWANMLACASRASAATPVVRHRAGCYTQAAARAASFSSGGCAACIYNCMLIRSLMLRHRRPPPHIKLAVRCRATPVWVLVCFTHHVAGAWPTETGFLRYRAGAAPC
jgi:hypothetical protein